MPVAALYPTMQAHLSGHQTPSETAYTAAGGFHLRFTIDGTDYTLTHPDETVHGRGWDLATAAGEPVLSKVSEFAVRMYVDAVAGFGRTYPDEQPCAPRTAALAYAIWAATPTPPAGLVLAKAAATA